MDNPKRGQRSATNHHNKMKKQKTKADRMRKTSASNSGGASVGGGT